MLTWIRIGRIPEVWRLGLMEGGRQTDVCASVRQMRGGEWFWQSWGSRRWNGHAGGDAGSRREAMKLASGYFATCIRASEPVACVAKCA